MGTHAFAEGNFTKAKGFASHAEGDGSESQGESSHAEGYGSIAQGDFSHSEGMCTEAIGLDSHAEGKFSTAIGQDSHAEGTETIANGDNQHVQGKNNIEDNNNKYAHIVGNGQDYEHPSNAHTIDWQGNGWFQGNVKVGGTSQDDANAQNLITEDKYNRLKATLPTTTGEGQDITLDKTAELEFKKPPLPMGNSEQVQYSGKNLFLPTLTEQTTSNNVTCTPNGDGTFTLNGTSNDSGRFNISSTPDKTYFTLEELGFSLNDQGFLNGCPVGGSTSSPTTKYKLFMSGQNGASNINDGGSGSIINANSSNMNGKYYLSIDYASGVTFNNLVFKPMIVKGITTSTSYEPYTNGASPNPDYPQEITNATGDVEVKVQNKNLILTKDWMNATINSDGSYNTTSSQERLCSTYIPIDIGKDNLTFSFNTVMDFFGIAFYDEDKNYINRAYLNQNNKITSQILSNSKYVKVFINKSGLILNGNSFEQYELQLEYNITPSTYTPHKEQKFIFPLGNEKLMLGDYLADDGIHHVKGQYNLNGDEGIVKYVNSTYAFALYIPNNIPDIKHNSNIDNIFCNKLLHSTLNNLYYKIETTGNNLISSQGSRTFAIMINNYTDINELKGYLKEQYNNGTPVKVEYELKEEVIVPYTSAQQEVYNQIKQALSYEEQTNISSNQNALFSVEAYQDAKVILAEKGTYSKPSTGIPKTDLASAVQTSLNKADSALQEHQDISGKQDITDNTLTTINKTVPTAINEVNSIAKLANKAKSYSTYQAFINYLNTAEKTEFIPGQSFMIQTKLVPDLWVYSVENTSVQYTYTTDEDFITYTNQATGGQVGYYKLAQLETQKVDLTDYATKTYVNNLFNSIVDGDEVSY